jgi:hypothetical protein
LKSRPALHRAGDGAPKNVLTCAEEIRPEVLDRADREQPLHEIDAGHALGHLQAKRPRTPHDPHAVDTDDVAFNDIAPQFGIALHLDELGDIECYVSRQLPAGHRADRSCNGVVEAQQIHRHA